MLIGEVDCIIDPVWILPDEGKREHVDTIINAMEPRVHLV